MAPSLGGSICFRDDVGRRWIRAGRPAPVSRKATLAGLDRYMQRSIGAKGQTCYVRRRRPGSVAAHRVRRTWAYMGNLLICLLAGANRSNRAGRSWAIMGYHCWIGAWSRAMEPVETNIRTACFILSPAWPLDWVKGSHVIWNLCKVEDHPQRLWTAMCTATCNQRRGMGWVWDGYGMGMGWTWDRYGIGIYASREAASPNAGMR
ncbi:hypothetical protein F5B22DRAFT_287261 [Xylaria bambusicola]|uniref:uncharacterized protein n=1 Tax=Xylaria bambusicola TaxID=326684 RepID=UPI002008C743|nr:uncharacterized protein F5B22DRAFT_287261 [Xylaria bambusicola]KAI0512861.1 hypothetical protein F5B22DRAFT_287261 [Xylaria bambusicola]